MTLSQYIMKLFVLINAFIVIGYGFESPSDYRYPRSPPNSYSVPLASVGPLHSTSVGVNRLTSALSPQKGARELTEDSFSSSKDVSSSSIASNESSPQEHSTANDTNESFSSSGLNGSSENFYSDLSEPGQNIIEKNIYVHLPAPQVEQLQQKADVDLPPPQTHYKIIFIRSPTLSSAPIIPSIPQNEERTIVYILSEKSEEQGNIVISTAEPEKSSRPEVYFVKYKAQRTESDESLTEARSSGTSLSPSNFGDKNDSNNKVFTKYGIPRSLTVKQ